MVDTSLSSKRAGHLGFAARLGFVALALAALVLGYLGLGQYTAAQPEDGLPGVLDLLYWDLQLFVMDSAPLQAGGELPWTLQFARFAAPAATLYALIATARAVLRNQIALARARYASGHTIICGTGRTQLFLAQGLVAENQKVVIIDPDARSDEAAPDLPSGVIRIRGDARDTTVLLGAGVRRAREVMALTTDSTFNGEVAIKVRAMSDSLRPGLVCFAEVAEPDLCAELAAWSISAGRSAEVRVVFFSRYDRTARRLLDRFPLTSNGDTSSDDDVRVVVVSDGYLRDALAKEIRRRWPCATSVLGDGPPLLIRSAKEVFDMRAAAALHVQADGGIPQPPSHVFICLEDDATAIRAGLKISRLYPSKAPHIVVATPISTVFGRELAVLAQPLSATPARLPGPRSASRLTLHNVTETVYSPEAVRRGDVEDIAQVAHEMYVTACRERGDTPETNPMMTPWTALPEFIKDDNRDQAADIGRKLAAIGAAVVPATGDEERFSFDDSEIELLAHMEHDRWVRRRREAGWSYSAVRDDQAHKHPDMIGWRELSDESREKDRSAIRDIPTQLRAAGFAVVRGVS